MASRVSASEMILADDRSSRLQRRQDSLCRPTLVMVADCGRRSLEEFYCRKNLCTDNGVHADDLAFPLVEGPSLFRMRRDPIFPMSCRSAAYSSCSISSSGRRMVFPMRELSQRTRSQCPVYSDPWPRWSREGVGSLQFIFFSLPYTSPAPEIRFDLFSRSMRCCSLSALLLPSSPRFHGTKMLFQAPPYLFRRAWLDQVVEGAGLHRSEAGLEIAERSEHYDRHGGRCLLSGQRDQSGHEPACEYRANGIGETSPPSRRWIARGRFCDRIIVTHFCMLKESTFASMHHLQQQHSSFLIISIQSSAPQFIY